MEIQLLTSLLHLLHIYACAKGAPNGARACPWDGLYRIGCNDMKIVHVFRSGNDCAVTLPDCLAKGEYTEFNAE